MSNLIPIADVLFDAEVFTDGDWVETRDQDPEGNVRLTQLADVGDGKWINKSARFLTSEKAKQLRCTYLRSGDLLVARMPDPLGRCCVFPGDSMPCVTVVDVCVVRPNQNRVDNRYLMHVINAPHGRRGIARHMTGTTRRRVSRKNLSKVEIPLPPLTEQRQIAGILDAADALRAKRREALAQLDTLLQSTFLDMFGDPVTNPMGWEVVSVGDEIGFLTSGSRGWAKYYAKDGDTFIRIQNLKDGQLDLGDIAFVKAPESAEAKRTTVEPGDVLLSITADLGRTAVVPRGIAKAHINQHLAILRFTSLNPVFVSYQLASKGGQAQFDRLNREGVKAGLNFNDVKSIRLANPPLALQHRFAAIVQSIEQQKASHRAHLAELDTLFASLQSRAFRGDL